MPVQRSRWPPALAILGVTALAIRLVYLYELRDSAFFSIPIGDSLQYDRWGREIAAGDWIGTEVYYQSPLYPYLLAVFYRVAGHDLFGVRIAQAILGAASAVLLAVGGSRFLDRRAGLVAGGLLAVYPPAIFFDGLIQKSSVDLFLITLLIAAIGAGIDQPKRRWLVLAGLAAGALALNRENARVLYPVVAGWLLLWHSSDAWKRRLERVAVFTLATAAVLAPVAIRNARIGGELLISTSQSGPNFYIGNHRGASGGYEPLVAGRGNALFEREDATRLAEDALGRSLAPGEVSHYWWTRALGEIRQAPGEWIRLMARKTWLTFAAHEPIDTESLEAYAAASHLLSALRWLTFGIVIALAAFGAWITRARWRRLSILYASFIALALSVVVFYVFARYRFPLAPIAILLAAAGLAGLPGLRSVPPRRWLPAAGVSLAIAILLHVPVRTSSDDTYLNYGSELLRLGRPADAIPLLERAARVDPGHAGTRLSLALALQQTGQPEKAIEVFREAVRLDPASAQAQVGLAIALHQHGQVRQALRFYDEALRLDPDYAEAMSNRAMALQQLGETPGAVSQFERAIARLPQSLPLRMNLCSLLLGAGRRDDALTCLREAAGALQRPQDAFQAEYALAQALLSVNRVDEARASLKRALAAARSSGNPQAIAMVEQAIGRIPDR